MCWYSVGVTDIFFSGYSDRKLRGFIKTLFTYFNSAVKKKKKIMNNKRQNKDIIVK